MEHCTSSLSSRGYSRVRVFCGPGEGIWPCPSGCCVGSLWYQACCYSPFGPCMTIVRAWFVFWQYVSFFLNKCWILPQLPFVLILFIIFMDKSRLLIYLWIYIPTYGHKLWIMTKRINSGIYVVEMSFLWRVPGLSLRNLVSISVIREELRLE